MRTDNNGRRSNPDRIHRRTKGPSADTMDPLGELSAPSISEWRPQTIVNYDMKLFHLLLQPE